MKDKKPLNWIPIYIDKYLFGSTRLELEPDERSVWMDLLVLGGKDSGYVRANEGMPYSIKQLAGMLVISEELLERTIEKCIKYGKIKILKDKTIYIQSWEQYKLTPRHMRRFESMSASEDTMSPKEDPIERDIDKGKEREKGKNTYAEFVKLTPMECHKLLDKYGKYHTDLMIEELNNYKASTGKTYKSDYYTILRWVANKILEKYPIGPGQREFEDDRKPDDKLVDPQKIKEFTKEIKKIGRKAK